MFKEGKNKDKYAEFDDDGVPTMKVTKKEPDGVEMKDSEIKPLKKQWDQAKEVWDKHQTALQAYQDEMTALEDGFQSDHSNQETNTRQIGF